MKMTKAIREFIEDKVQERVDSHPDLLAAKEAADAEAKAFATDIETLQTRFNTELRELSNRYNYSYPAYGGEPLPVMARMDCYSVQHLPAKKEYNQLRQEINHKADQAAKEIIVSMELGGTKAELLAMIAKLNF